MFHLHAPISIAYSKRRKVAPQLFEDEAKAPSSAALARSFVFGSGNETTGIEGITIIGTDVQRHGTLEGIFDLQGGKISNPTKGIYIKNNKKVIIKFQGSIRHPFIVAYSPFFLLHDVFR